MVSHMPLCIVKHDGNRSSCKKDIFIFHLFCAEIIELDYMKYKSSIFTSNISTQMIKE